MIYANINFSDTVIATQYTNVSNEIVAEVSTTDVKF